MLKDLKNIFGDPHGLDEKSVNFLTKALEKHNLPGFDYLEFKQSLSALTQMNMEPETAFKSAFATASTMGLTKSKLLESASHYQKVMLKEKEQFDKALQNRIAERIDGKKKEVDHLIKQVAEYENKIQQLKDQISKHQQVIDNADAEIADERSKIESTKEGFELTLNSIMNQIEKDISQIGDWL